MKRYDVLIPADCKTGKLFPLACRLFPEIPTSTLRKAFEKRDVKQDGVRMNLSSAIQPGATLTLFIPDKPLNNPVKVHYEDEHVMVVIKPAGMSCEPDKKGGKTVTDCVSDWLKEQGRANSEVFLCHRLDNQTDGLLLLAKDIQTQEQLQEAFALRNVHKRYHCIVHNTPSPKHQVESAYLRKDAMHSKVYVSKREMNFSKPICTEYTVVKGGECCLVEIALHTGRTHQIRAHMAYLGHPLLGDDQYGERSWNKQMNAKRLFLTSTSLSFNLSDSLAYLNDLHFQIKPMFSYDNFAPLRKNTR